RLKHAGLIPKAGLYKHFQRLRAALHYEGLDVPLIQVNHHFIQEIVFRQLNAHNVPRFFAFDGVIYDSSNRFVEKTKRWSKPKGTIDEYANRISACPVPHCQPGIIRLSCPCSYQNHLFVRTPPKQHLTAYPIADPYSTTHFQ